MKTIHAFSALNPAASLVRAYRRVSYRGSAPTANAIIVISGSFLSATERYVNVSGRELTPIGEAVSHDTVTPDDADAARSQIGSYSVTGPHRKLWRSRGSRR
jgi:hypothetical protein